MELFSELKVHMELIKKSIHWLDWGEYSWLCLLVVLTLGLHFAIITNPNELIFDEQHYVPDARSILDGNGSARVEHPSLGKLFIVSGLIIFGDNPFGWRSFSVIFGAISIIFFYLICRRLEMPKKAAYLATLLLALENMAFVQASVAMLDVFTFTFMLICFWLYLRGNYLLSGVAAGLCTLTKLTGILIVLAVLLHWLIVRRDKRWRFVGAALLVPVSFIIFTPLFDFFAYGYLTNPIERVEIMLSISTNWTFANVTHPYATYPWTWILLPTVMPYWNEPHYMSAISFNIWVLIIPIICYLVFKAVKRSDAGLFAISWFTATYLMWIPISFFTDRISFVYYFYPTVGAICIGLGLWLSRLIEIGQTRETGKLRLVTISTVVAYLSIHIIVFTVISPFSWLSWSWLLLVRA
jgi:dolichyl-phosphate-mannose-protein mannosyltransferase